MLSVPPIPSSALYQALCVLAQGMKNQSVRATIAVQNYVNADSTGSKPGAEPYRRRTTVFKNYVDPRTGTNIPLLEKVGVDTAPFGKYYDPSHPAANAQGMVLQPNVNRYFETADFQESNLLMAACSRLYEAASIVIQRTHDLMIKA